MDILAEARDVLLQEAKGIENLIPSLDQSFVNAVNMILDSKGRVIVTGMGKSGHIARKVSATLSSTGTPSIFLHPAEAIHGDLGMVTGDDVVLAFSKSGETTEVLNILPSLKRIGAKVIAIVGEHNSTLAKNSDVVLDVLVEKEACPLGLAPTTSTTVSSCFRAIISPKTSLPFSIPVALWAANCSLLLPTSCIRATIIRLSALTARYRMPSS